MTPQHRITTRRLRRAARLAVLPLALLLALLALLALLVACGGGVAKRALEGPGDCPNARRFSVSVILHFADVQVQLTSTFGGSDAPAAAGDDRMRAVRRNVLPDAAVAMAPTRPTRPTRCQA